MPRVPQRSARRKVDHRASYCASTAITGCSHNEAVRARVLGDGAVDCLLKPFNEDVLLNAVNAALGQAGAESESVSEKGENDVLITPGAIAKQ